MNQIEDAEILRKLILITSTIKKCGEILAKEHKKPKLPKGEPEPGGVFYIDPTIQREFSLIEGKSMKAIDLADLYVSWSERTLACFEANEEFLWNPKLAGHCFDNYLVIATAFKTFNLK